MAKITLMVKVNDPYFQHQPRVSHNACLVQFLVMPAQICEELSYGQAKFPRILSKMTEMTLKMKVNNPYFQYQSGVSQHACFVQIGDSSSKLWRVIVRIR